MGFKVFTNNATLTAEDVNDYLMEQGVLVFDDASDRDNQLVAPQEGMIAYLKNENALYFYIGYAWVLFNEDTSWLTLSLQNGWITHGSGTSPRYRRKNGIVYVKGLIKSGTTASGTTVATLPVGFRPAEQYHIGTASNNLFAVIRVDSTGAISTSGTVSNTWLSLDTMQFPAA